MEVSPPVAELLARHRAGDWGAVVRLLDDASGGAVTHAARAGDGGGGAPITPRTSSIVRDVAAKMLWRWMLARRASMMQRAYRKWTLIIERARHGELAFSRKRENTESKVTLKWTRSVKRVSGGALAASEDAASREELFLRAAAGVTPWALDAAGLDQWLADDLGGSSALLARACEMWRATLRGLTGAELLARCVALAAATERAGGSATRAMLASKAWNPTGALKVRVHDQRTVSRELERDLCTSRPTWSSLGRVVPAAAHGPFVRSFPLSARRRAARSDPPRPGRLSPRARSSAASRTTGSRSTRCSGTRATASTR